MAVIASIISKFDDRGFRDASKSGDTLDRKFQTIGRTSGLAFGAILGAGIYAAKGFETAERASAKLSNVLDSMGYGDAAKRVDAYAESLQTSLGVDADVIKATQTKLATFGNLTKSVGDAGGAFDRATVAALDLAAAGFGTAEGNAVQLGKALEDPVKGISALAKSGVTFTAQEKEKIKTLVESGKTLEAQDIVLKAIEKQVGGTAEANVSSFDKIKLSMDSVSDALGEGLLPVVEDLTPKFQEFGTWASANSGLITKLVVAVGALAGGLYTLSLGVKAYKTITEAAKIAQIAWNIAMSANPIGLVVIAIAALAAGFVIAYKKSETFRNIVNGAMDGVKTAVGWVVDKFQALWDVIKKVADAIKDSTLGKFVGKVIDGFRATGGSIYSGGTYVVGEAGPEVITTNRNAYVVPNSRLGGGQNITINVTGALDPAAVADQISRLLARHNSRLGLA